MATCRVYWGSHGCIHERGHEIPHECDCCECPGDICLPECVATAPYYGPDTRFYGADANEPVWDEKGGDTPCQQTPANTKPDTCDATEQPDATKGNGETPTCTSPS